MPDADKPTLLVIDGHSLAFRAFYALPVDSFSTRDGQHTNAIHGFLSMLLLLLQNEKPTHLAVAFDISRQSFRTREYAEYKGNRGETPPEFKGQVPLLQDALQAMGIRTIEKEDFEADDILATLATQASADGYRVLLVSGDRDTIQLVDDDVTLLYPNTQGVSQLKRYDTAAVIERYGIRPEQYPDIAALVGETSDNLPGISKVGEKTAVKWLGLYGDLEGILAHADEIKGVVGQNLRDQRENAERNRRLNRLVRDVPLDVVLDELKAKPIELDAVRPLFERLEFRTLMERLTKLAAGEANGNGAPAPAPVAAQPAEAVPAAIAPTPRTLLDEELATWLERAIAAEPAGLGLSLDVIDGRVVGAGIATSDETVRLAWQAGARRVRPVRGVAGERRPEDHDRREGAAQGADALGPRVRRTRARHRSWPAGSCVRSSRRSRSPTSSPSTSARRFRSRTRRCSCPKRAPTPVLPSTRGTPCASRRSCSARSPRAPAGCSPRSRCRSCRCSPPWNCAA